MRVLVTGARGKVGRAAVVALQRAGHETVATDLAEPEFDTPPAGTAAYVKTDLTDAGQVYALVGGASVGEGPKAGPFEAVVHAGAIPAPGRHAPHVVFANNLTATFNVVEACVRWGVRRLVNISSETVPGFIFAERPFLPEYLPVDEAHPVRPQDPYALAKLFGEQLCDAAVQRSELRCISIRPTWVQTSTTYGRNLGPFLADRAKASVTGWSYIDADDLAEAIRLAAESEVPGHEIIYIAAEDTIGGRHLHEAWQSAYPQSGTVLHPVSRPDASGIDTAKARTLLGWHPSRTWRDYLSDDGQPVDTSRPIDKSERG